MPKDLDKIEIEISAQEEQTLRQQVLSDVDKMAQKGVRFSPWWWRQLAQEDKALEVEALLFNSAAKPTPAKGSKKRKERADVFEVEMILEEEKGYILVRWAGYHPSWEPWRMTGAVGDPIDTWEKATAKMKRTQAYQDWQGAQPGA